MFLYPVSCDCSINFMAYLPLLFISLSTINKMIRSTSAVLTKFVKFTLKISDPQSLRYVPPQILQKHSWVPKHYEDLPEPIIQTTCQQLIIIQRFLIKDIVIRYMLKINIKSFTSQISFNSDNWYLSVASRSLGDLVLRFSIFPA